MDATGQYSNSLAEQTIGEYSPSISSRADKPLVAGKNRKMYPQDPTNQYSSHYLDEFKDYIDCGSTAHRFRMCPRKDEKALRDLFWEELWDHIPSSRK